MQCDQVERKPRRTELGLRRLVPIVSCLLLGAACSNEDPRLPEKEPAPPSGCGGAGHVGDGCESPVVDQDRDGYASAAQGGDDCNDADHAIHPGATEICGDAIDQDCDGSDLSCAVADVDLDGFTPSEGDCDDFKAYVHPGAVELCGDGIDQDCDGSDLSCDLLDRDGDGFSTAQGDCDDTDETVHPGRFDICEDGIDQNCDGADRGCDDPDLDEDGFSVRQGDCDDDDAAIHPDAVEICGDEIDQDCDGGDLACPLDVDGDGHSFAEGDCDDDDAAIFPGAIEIAYDGIDQDCSGADLIDRDGDCVIAAAAGGLDCDDDDPLTYPGAPEPCGEGIDRNCDGVVLACLPIVDVDGDGAQPPPAGADCDDDDPLRYFGAEEIPFDGIDQDCDGMDFVGDETTSSIWNSLHAIDSATNGDVVFHFPFDRNSVGLARSISGRTLDWLYLWRLEAAHASPISSFFDGLHFWLLYGRHANAPTALFGQRFRPSGELVGAPIRLGADGALPSRYAGAGYGGDAVLVWTEPELGIWLRTVDRFGVLSTPARIVEDGVPEAIDPSSLSIERLSESDYAIAWAVRPKGEAEPAHVALGRYSSATGRFAPIWRSDFPAIQAGIAASGDAVALTLRDEAGTVSALHFERAALLAGSIIERAPAQLLGEHAIERATQVRATPEGFVHRWLSDRYGDSKTILEGATTSPNALVVSSPRAITAPHRSIEQFSTVIDARACETQAWFSWSSDMLYLEHRRSW